MPTSLVPHKAGMCPLMDLESRILKSRYQQGWFLLETLKENLLHLLSPATLGWSCLTPTSGSLSLCVSNLIVSLVKTSHWI